MNSSSLEISRLSSEKKLGEPYLKIQLDAQTLALLPLKETQEVIVIPSRRITPIPNMPSYVLGLLNQRNRVFWMVDLAKLLGLISVSEYVQQYNVAIIRANDVPLGLLIQDIKGVFRFNLDEIQSPLGVVSSNLIPYLRGSVIEDNKILFVLDTEAIINHSILN